MLPVLLFLGIESSIAYSLLLIITTVIVAAQVLIIFLLYTRVVLVFLTYSVIVSIVKAADSFRVSVREKTNFSLNIAVHGCEAEIILAYAHQIVLIEEAYLRIWVLIVL